MKAFGLKRVLPNQTCVSTENIFNRNHEPYRSLGEVIREAVHYGSDTGVPAFVQFDPSDVDEVDVLTSPDHDMFDIAEQFGQEPAALSGRVSGEDEQTE